MAFFLRAGREVSKIRWTFRTRHWQELSLSSDPNATGLEEGSFCFSEWGVVTREAWEHSVSSLSLNKIRHLPTCLTSTLSPDRKSSGIYPTSLSHWNDLFKITWSEAAAVKPLTAMSPGHRFPPFMNKGDSLHTHIHCLGQSWVKNKINIRHHFLKKCFDKMNFSLSLLRSWELLAWQNMRIVKKRVSNFPPHLLTIFLHCP